MPRFLLLALVYFPAVHLFGQTLPYGIKAGMHLSTVVESLPFYYNDVKPGFHAGVFTSIPLGKVFTFQPELVYSVQGSRASYHRREYRYSAGETAIHLSYLTIPLTLKLNIYRGFNAQFVFQPGILITAREKGEAVIYPTRPSSLNPPVRVNENVMGSYRNYDAALGAGLGYDTNSRLSVDVRVLLGLADILKPGSQMHTLREDWNRVVPGIKKPTKNYLLQLSLRYTLKRNPA